MFSLTASDRFYLYPYPTDMRKSFYTLSGIVTNLMGMDVQQGDAFVFINKPCTASHEDSSHGIWWLGHLSHEVSSRRIFSS